MTINQTIYIMIKRQVQFNLLVNKIFCADLMQVPFKELNIALCLLNVYNQILNVQFSMHVFIPSKTRCNFNCKTIKNYFLLCLIQYNLVICFEGLQIICYNKLRSNCQIKQHFKLDMYFHFELIFFLENKYWKYLFLIL